MIRGSEHPQHPPGTSRGAEAPPLHRINGAGKVQWVGSTDRPIRDLLADAERDPDDDGRGSSVYTVAHECEIWLEDFLHDKTAKRSEVMSAGTARPPGPGFNQSAIRRAASNLNVVMRDSPSFPRFTWWSLPAHSRLNLDDAPVGA